MSAQEDPWGRSRACFAELEGWLNSTEATALSHAELEDELDRRGRELLRQMLQGQLDLRAMRERRAEEVRDTDGVRHGAVETGHTRSLGTIFGVVSVTRLAYRRRGHANLYPADGRLNLPQEHHSHRLRRLSAIEGSRGSFEEATAAIRRTTGRRLGKRQVEALAARAAADVEEFYAHRRPPPGAQDDVLISNAAVQAVGSVQDLTLEDYAWVLGVDLWGVVHGVKAFLPHLLERPESHVVTIGSANSLVPFPTASAYVAAKHAVDGFTGALEQELAGTPVRVSIVYPGTLATDAARRARHVTTTEAGATRQRALTSPERAARLIARGVERNRSRIYVGADMRALAVANRVAPPDHPPGAGLGGTPGDGTHRDGVPPPHQPVHRRVQLRRRDAGDHAAGSVRFTRTPRYPRRTRPSTAAGRALRSPDSHGGRATTMARLSAMRTTYA